MTWPFDPKQTSNNSVRFVLKKSKLKNIHRAQIRFDVPLKKKL